MAKQAYVKVPGSEKVKAAGAKVAGAADPDKRVIVTLMLRQRRPLESTNPSPTAASPTQRTYMTRADMAAEHGATAADIQAVEKFAHDNGLTVVRTNIPAGIIKLSGTVAQMNKAFDVKLKKYKAQGRTYRGREGAVCVPKSLGKIVEGVFGLDNRPAAKPHLRILSKSKGAASSRASANALAGFDPAKIGKLYSFPINASGKGQCIALIELNDFDENPDGSLRITGTGFDPADLKAFFGSKVPQVSAIGVAGGANMPGPDPNADGEVALDIEVAGAVARDAQIAVYFAPNTDDGFLEAILSAIHDDVRKPSVISISWGQKEDNLDGKGGWTAQSRNAFERAFKQAAKLGVTVTVAAGDNGSNDGTKGKAHVDFPASAPHVLACGGTRLAASGNNITSEVVWNDSGATGGGVSDHFAQPAYQKLAGVPNSLSKKYKGRGVPDVAGNASPNSGYRVIVGGQQEIIGGTSAVAPLMAGLIALMNEKLSKPVGFLNPMLYAPAAAGCFRDIVQGQNDLDGEVGGYKAKQGWDACSGLGVPNGQQLLISLSSAGALIHARPAGIAESETAAVVEAV